MNQVVVVMAGVVIVGLVAYFFTLYNGLVAVKNNIHKAWANIDVLLKQRHDEIPKLVKVCEGYAQFEKKTLTDVIALRNSTVSARTLAERSESENQLTAGLHRLFAVAENYPELRSNNNFLQLQHRVSNLEDLVADRREFYNESVNNYNIRIESMPDAFVANLMNLKPQEMYTVATADKEDVAMNFNLPQ